MKKQSKILVHRDFRNALKKRAIDEDVSMFKLTERLSMEIKNEKTTKRPKFDLHF